MGSLIVREYVTNTKVFFEKYALHLEGRINNHNEDIERSGLMVAWIFYIVKINVASILKKLEYFQKIIPVPPNIQEFTYLDLWNSLIGINQIKTDNNGLSIQNDALLSPIVQKTTEYLRRAKETLELQLEEIQSTAYFIPTEYMLRQQEETQSAHQECLRLLSAYQSIMPSDTSQKKSWLAKVLHLGIILVQIQRVAFGLLDNLSDIFREKKIDLSRIPSDHKTDALNKLKHLVQKLDDPLILFHPTNKTKKTLFCDGTEDFCLAHYNYFPSAIETPLHNVKKLVENRLDADLQAQEVLNQIRKYSL